MFSESIYQFGLNAIAFSSLILLVTTVIAVCLRRSAAAVFSCCFGGLIVALFVPVFGIIGDSVNAQSLSIPVSSQLVSFGYFPIQSALVAEDRATPARASTAGVGSGSPIDTAQSAASTTPMATQSSRFWSMIRLCSIWDVAILVWAVGAVLCLVRLIAAVVGVRRIVNASRELSEEMNLRHRNLLKQLLSQRISVRFNDHLSSPVAVQWPQRSILVPTTFFSNSSDATIRRILEHERAHILRRDHLTLLLEEFIASVYWFNPIMYIIKRWADRAREDICDNWVLANFDSADYCRDLLACTETASLNRRALAPGFVRSHKIASRIRSLVNQNRITKIAISKRLATMIGLILLGLGSLAFFAGFDFAQQEKGSKKPAIPDMAELLEMMKNFSNPSEISATVTDRTTGNPVAGAKIQLLHVDALNGGQNTLATDVTDMAGSFRFANLKRHEERIPMPNYVVLVSRKGYSSQVLGLRNSVSFMTQKNDWQISLGPAATLTGRVVDKTGEPISGATVWQPMFLAKPVEGVKCAMSDMDGRFEIKDHSAFQPINGKPDRNGISKGQPSTLMMVRHPDYGRQYIEVATIPDDLKINMEKAFSVNGRVVDKTTGQPLAGLTVVASGHDHRTFEIVKTNQEGLFEMNLTPISKFNIWVRHPKLDAAAITVSGKSSETVTTDDFQLEPLVTIKGTLIDDETGKPIKPMIETHQINWYGDARPKTTSECKTAPVLEDGTFEMRVLPGKIFPYVGNYSLIDVDREKYKDGIVISRDEPIELEFRVRTRDESP